jgi:subtilisin family serine protease
VYKGNQSSSKKSHQRDRWTKWKKKRHDWALTHKDPRNPPGRRPDKTGRDPGRRPPIVIVPSLYDRFPPRREQRPQGQPQLQSQRVERQILVLIDQSRSPAVAGQLAQAYGLEVISTRPIALLGARATLFRVRNGRSEDDALAALQNDQRVRSAQFNLRYFHSDDRRGGSKAIDQYGPRAVRLPDAHRLALGRNVVVAVIDSAVDKAHPDLAGAIVQSFDVVGDKDAQADFHGTAVAGIIRSHGLVEGVAPMAKIMSVRAFHTNRGAAMPETTTARLLAAVDVAVDKGARVLNMSFVGGRDRQLHEALQEAYRRGVVLVASAGNGGPQAAPAYPAAYPEVIAVTAIDEGDNRYEHANRGGYIVIAAPGVDILAPVEGGKHELVSGTSFATAYVSGIAALLLEGNPGMNTAGIANLIAAGADDLGPPGRDDDFGAGRVNALKALRSMLDLAARLQGAKGAGDRR